MAKEYTKTSVCERCGRSWVHNKYTHPRFCSSDCSNKRRGDNFEARFYARIDRSAGPDACWRWTGPRDKDGYGKVVHYSVGDTRAHRVAFEFHLGLPLGSLTADVIVRHSCDNPPCCNPAHLLSGGHRENTDDKIRRDRHTKGEDVNTAVLTEAEVMEARELWRDGFSIKSLAAKFGLSKSAMHYAVKGKSWKHLPLVALCLLLLVVPAFGQGRLVITDGSTQSEYGAPSSDRNVICPVCEKAGKKSTVRRWLGYSSTMYFSPNLYERTEARFWDEDGRYHDHELAQELLVCSAGHRFYDFDDRRCWCEWPHKRYVVLDEVKTDSITVPSGTLQQFFITPASYQHPFIKPDLQAQASAAAVDRAKTLAHPQSDYYKEDAFNWVFWLGSAGYWGSFAADIKTTMGSLERGSIELNPVFGHSNGHAVRYTANAVATAGIYGIVVYCEKRNHRRLARALLYVGTAVRTAAAIWNHSRRR